MTIWTPTARQELENHLAGLRVSLAGSGADPEEVLDDVRRHVAEEASAARLPVVTEVDVRRFLARVAPLAPGFGMSTESPGREPSPERAPRGAMAPEPPEGSDWVGFLRQGALVLFGVLLPLFTLGFELWTRACAQEFFDPVPTGWHLALVALVPIANALALVRWAGVGGRVHRLRWLLNSAALGVGLAYAALFGPLTPFAVIGVIFGIGFLPLAPLLGFISSLSLRRRLAREVPSFGTRLRREGWVAFLVPLVLLGALASSSLLNRHYSGVAAGEDAARADAAVRWLRAWGDHDLLLRDSYGYRRGLWDEFLPPRPPAEEARQLYFRVTGQPFNAVPPPRSARSRQNQGFFREFELGGAEWDSALGGEAVAGRVRGLSLVASRLDATADATAAWSYTEWTLEFRNDHERSQREARAQIQLPPGGVVSRLTLWVNGEEREAAFAGRSQVREAYQKVAVQQRRDPVLVTTCGPDRVLMQCFPVPPSGGTMKVRLGITAPLTLVGADQAALIWPSFLERNFGLNRSFVHGLWLDLPGMPVRPVEGLAVSTDAHGRVGVHGDWVDSRLGDPQRAVMLRRDAAAATAWAPDRHGVEAGFVRQRIVPVPPPTPGRLALVIDASRGMQGAVGEVAAALESAPVPGELGIFVAQDGVVRLAEVGGVAAAVAALRALRVEGGHDAIPALLQAWEWAAAEPGGAVVWVHGPQPVLLSSAESIRQRLQWSRGEGAPLLYDFTTRPGPNRVSEQLDRLLGLVLVPRLDSVQADLTRLLAQRSGREPLWSAQREHVDGEPTTAESGGPGSTHLTRLWALGEVRRLLLERKPEAATHLASRYQLVTPVSGAVVLETQQQYVQAGLQPVDPSTVPVVPEPGVLPLLVLGALALGWRRRASRARLGDGSVA